MDTSARSTLTLRSPWGRLALEPPAPADDPAAAAMRSDPAALRHLPWMPPTMTPAEWRTIRESRAADPEIWNFNIHLTAQPEIAPSPTPPSTFIGQCGIMYINPQNSHAEIGIILCPTQHRTALGTEALYTTLAHAFEYPGLRLHRVEFVTSEYNVSMRGWLEGFGVGAEYRMREAWTDGQGGWLDCVGYAVLEGEWPALKARMRERLSARLGPPVDEYP